MRSGYIRILDQGPGVHVRCRTCPSGSAQQETVQGTFWTSRTVTGIHRGTHECVKGMQWPETPPALYCLRSTVRALARVLKEKHPFSARRCASTTAPTAWELPAMSAAFLKGLRQ